MRILQITAHFSPNIGGVETHLDDLVSALIENGNRVFVLTYQPLQTKAYWKIIERKKGLKIFRIPWLPGLFYKLVNRPMLEFLYLFPGIFLVTPFAILVEKPEVIHAHGLVACAVAVFWGKVFKIRSVVSTHNIYNFPPSGFYREFVEWIFNNVDSILCLSSKSADEIRLIVKDKSKVKIFTSWVDLKKFRPRGDKEALKKKLGMGNKFTVLFVGRLVPEKGVGELLRAAESWNKNINLVIVGSGVMEGEVEKVSLGSKNVKYSGNVGNESIPDYYRASDITIVPSVHEEGFGRVIPESLACGTPVIGAKRGAIPSVMDETVGKLIDVSPENIKKAVEYFYDNPRELKRTRVNARKFAMRRYSQKNLTPILESYIKSD